MRDSSYFLVLIALLAVGFASSSSCDAQVEFECPSDGEFYTECIKCAGYTQEDEKHGNCVDRTLFDTGNEHYHYLGYDIGGMFVWFIVAGVATACGVGGGGIYMPLGILLFQFSAKGASGFSQACIFGASTGGFLLNIFNNHPNQKILSTADAAKNENREEEEEEEKEGGGGEGAVTTYTRPLIDYDMCLVLAPMEMAGATLGVLVQKMLPNWLYLGLAAIILAVTAFKTFKTFQKARDAETKARTDAADHDHHAKAAHDDKEEDPKAKDIAIADANAGASDDSIAPTSAVTAKEEEHEPLQASAGDVEATVVSIELTAEQHKAQVAFLELDSRQIPREKVGALILLWVVLVLLTFLKGGKGVDSLVGVTCTDPGYPILVTVQFLWMFLFSLYFGVRAMRGCEAREAVHYPYQPKDLHWTRDSLGFYTGWTFVAGIVAGLIGVGGGMVLGPLMLSAGIDARVSTATTATMVVLTSSSVAVMYVITGYVPFEYAIFYFFVCMSGAYVGKTQIDGFVKRTGTASTLIAILGTIIALSVFGILTTLFLKLEAQNFCFDGFQSLCH